MAATQAIPAQPFDDQTPMPFGKFRGCRLGTVPAQYLLWLHDCGVNNPQLKAYIISNLDALKKEAGRR